MGKEKFIKGKKIIIVKKIFKTIILSCIVLTFFVLKIPLFFIKIFYNLFSFKCNRQVYEVLYDNHNYDYRVWYLQYIDKGFSFLFTSSEKLKIPENYNYKEKKKLQIPFMWYLEIQFRRIFLLQKYLFFNLLFHIWFILFEKNYFKFYWYSILTILRLIFGEFVIKNLDGKKKKIINIFVILIKKLFDEDFILKEIKSNYNLKKKIKNYLSKFLNKLKYKILIFSKNVYIFIIKYFIMNIYIVFIKIVYLLKLICLTWKNFVKYMKVKKREEKIAKKENTERNFKILYIYKPNIFKFHLKNSYDLNLNQKLLNITNPKNIKLKKNINNRKKKKLISKELIFKYKLYQIRWKTNFLNAKNISLQAFSKLKTYSDWVVYKYRFIEKIIFKKTMQKLIWTKIYESSFSLDVEWDLFLLGDNFIYGFLEDLKYIWEDPNKRYSVGLYEVYFNWSLIRLPYRDFIDSFLRKSLLNNFVKRHVLKTYNWVKNFSNETLIYINQNYYQKEIIALFYDSYYYYVMWTFENYNNVNKSLQEKILKYLKTDFEALKINFDDLKDILDIEDSAKNFIDTKIKKHKEVRNKIKNILKGDLFNFSSYYENDFFMFRWIKFYGLKLFDLELYDKKILKISKVMSKNLINSNFSLNNIWFETFNLKIFKKLQTNVIYKLLEKKNGMMPFFFSNNLRNNWMIWSSKMSNIFNWVSKKKKPLKWFRKLKKANLEKKLNVFVFCISIWKYMNAKTFKLRNLKVFAFILEEWKRKHSETQKYKKKSKMELVEFQLKNTEIFEFINIKFTMRDLFCYIYIMYKYNRIKGIFKVIFDIILFIIIFIIKKTLNYIKK